MSEQVEIAIVGAGPGGLSAALVAAQAGVQVVLIDHYRQVGGQYFRQPLSSLPLTTAQRQGAALRQQVLEAGAKIYTDTVVWGIFQDRVLGLYSPKGITYVQAQVIILATGAYDRPIAFPGWTLPGVMTTGAVQTLLKEQRLVPGQRVLLTGTGPLQLVLAAELVQAGAKVVAVLEANCFLGRVFRYTEALWGQWGRLGEASRSWLTLQLQRVPYRMGWGIVSVEGARQVERATIAPLDAQGYPIAGREEKLECDTVALGYGFIPFNTLARLLGVQHVWRPELGGEVPIRDAHLQTTVPQVYAVGDCAGIGGARLAQLEGQVAGYAAAIHLGYRPTTDLAALNKALEHERRFQKMYHALFTPPPGVYALSHDDTVICRCEEITQGEIRRAIASGAHTTNEVKLLTRAGMGNCQGRMCAHLIARWVAHETGRSLEQVGGLPPRPPLFPVPVADLGRKV
jgi:NADPH-dependent 2,4-dienoyl-CoA reductase/sulfur reductase-like enzyme